MPMGRIEIAGEQRDVCMAYVLEARPGDYVLIQHGFAVTLMSQEEAQEAFKTWQELGVLDEHGQPLESAAHQFPTI